MYFLCVHSFTALLFVCMDISESGHSCVQDSADGSIKFIFSRFRCDRKKLGFLEQFHQHKAKEARMQPAKRLCIPYSLSGTFSTGPQLWKAPAEPLESGSSGSRNGSWANLGIETSATCLLQVCSVSWCGSQNKPILTSWFWATSYVPTLVLYSYFLRSHQSLNETRLSSLWRSVKYWSGKKSIFWLPIRVICYYCYFLSNPILLVSFTLAECRPQPCRAACWLPVTGRLRHPGARPAQLHACHCPALCRVLQMAVSPGEWADRQLHPRGNLECIIRKHCVRISYGENSIKPLPQAQPLSRVQGDSVYLSGGGWGGWFFVYFLAFVLSPATCEQKCQNAVTVAVLAMFILGLQMEYIENPISEFTLVRLILAQPR